MRGGMHPHKDREMLEREIEAQALKLFMSNPNFAKRGLKWCFNFIYFRTMYCASSEKVREYIYNYRPFPEWIEIEASTCCPLKCQMCEHTHWKEKSQNMTFEQFKKIIDEMPELRWFGFTGIGESYFNPDYKKMLDYARAKNPACFFEIFDNFNWVKTEDIEHWFDVGIDKVYVSMDAATKDTYEKIRVNGNFDTVVKNIKKFDKMKKVRNSYFPELWFHYIFGKHNVHEMKKYLDLIHEMGVDVKQVQFTKLLHAYPEVKKWVMDISDEERKDITEYGAKLGIRITWNINTKIEKDRLNQCTVWGMPFIFVTGDLIPCCSLNEQNDRPWQVKTSLGNIFKDDFRKIWYGKKYKKLVDDLKENKCSGACTRCILYKKNVRNTHG